MARSYEQASRLLEKLMKGNAGIKSLAFGNTSQNSGLHVTKQAYALVCETLKYKAILDDLFKISGLAQAKARHALLLILAYELLFGRKKIKGGGKVKKLVMGKQDQLTAALARLKSKRGVQTDYDLLPDFVRAADRIPRYCRVNAILTDLESVCKALEADGYYKSSSFGHNQQNSKAKDDDDGDEKSLDALWYHVDSHVPDLLVLPANTDLHSHELVKSGHLILQDKASCFPPCALSPPGEWSCIDACAAPGNKTSHLIAILHSLHRSGDEGPNVSRKRKQICSDLTSSSPIVHAFERDQKRAKLLATRLSAAGVDSTGGGWEGQEWRGETRGGRVRVQVHHRSFLEASPEQFQEVKAIVVDPTCSGSGMIGRVDHLLRHHSIGNSCGASRKRVAAIASFQKRILSHALSFPSVERVVYSTCSVHDEENEHVVADVLASNPEFVLMKALPEWQRRGRHGKGAKTKGIEVTNCVRADPVKDLTTGFFVAVFERRRGRNKGKRLREGEHGPQTTTSEPGGETGGADEQERRMDCNENASDAEGESNGLAQVQGSSKPVSAKAPSSSAEGNSFVRVNRTRKGKRKRKSRRVKLVSRF